MEQITRMHNVKSHGVSSSLSEKEEQPEEKHLIHNKKRIIGLLQSIIKHKSLIHSHLEAGRQSFLTALLDIDNGGSFIVIDASKCDESNLRVTNSKFLLCYTQLERVNVRFRLNSPVHIDYQGLSAFRTPLPENIYYQQRREHYRLETIITDSPSCTIRGNDSDGEPLLPPLRVIDISSGGLAIFLPYGMPLLDTGENYSSCLLQLYDTVAIEVGLTVCSQVVVNKYKNNAGARVSMKFTHLPRGGEEIIQRYIMRIERKRNSSRFSALTSD